jgi:hypothetical protein
MAPLLRPTGFPRAELEQSFEIIGGKLHHRKRALDLFDQFKAG